MPLIIVLLIIEIIIAESTIVPTGNCLLIKERINGSMSVTPTIADRTSTPLPPKNCFTQIVTIESKTKRKAKMTAGFISKGF